MDFMKDKNFIDSMKWFAEQMPGGFLIYSADTREEIIYINKSGLKLFGCENMEDFKALTGNRFSGLIYPEDRERVLSAIEAQIADSGNANMDYVEYRITRKDGSIGWLEDYGHYAELPGYGKVYYVFINDITDKKNIEAETELSSKVIASLSQTYSCIYLLNMNKGLMRAYYIQNEFFKAISANIGLEEGKSVPWLPVMRRYAGEYVIEEDRKSLLDELSVEKFKERLSETSSYSHTYRCPTYDGGIVYVTMIVMRIGKSKASEHIVLAFRDVTADTLQAQNDLANKLKIEMELEQQRHANEIKTNFLFNISHDIRTPMNSIMGFTALAVKHLDDKEKAGEYLEKVEISGRQLTNLIDDILEMSGLEQGNRANELTKVELCSEIESIAGRYRADAEGRSLTVDTSFELSDSTVLIDAESFRRIIGNLISNAVKFTPKGGKINISAGQSERSESGYARYSFTVADTGIGISEDFIGRIYDAFERETSSTKAGTYGTGLGLSIVKKLVDIMGGSISVKSKKNEGSSFTVELPLRSAAAAEAAGEELVEYGEVKYDHKLRVLLVEDIEFNRMLAETVLEEADFLVESVTDGSEAVKAISEHPSWYYDIVLMDIQMPVMDGYEATRKIRAIKRGDIPTLPIIALSANARDEDKKQSIKSGMNSHISKPFDVEELLSIINEYSCNRGMK